MERFEKILTSVARGMTWISGAVLVIMMLLTVLSVIGRPVNMAPIGIPEMIGYGMVIVVCFGFAYNTILKDDISVDVLVNFLPRRIKAFVIVLMDILGLGLFSFIAWQGIATARDEYLIGDISPVLGFPVTPFRVILVLGFGMLCVVLIMDMLKSISEVIRK